MRSTTLLRLVHTQRGRRLVQDDDLYSFRADHSADRYRLALTTGQVRQGPEHVCQGSRL